jgi:hypothetical protein
MHYNMTKPCAECPFLKAHQRGYTMKRLKEFASGEFPCHKTADGDSGSFKAKRNSEHCAGALIFLEKRHQSHQMMRICERLGMYDYRKLDMTSPVR